MTENLKLLAIILRNEKRPEVRALALRLLVQQVRIEARFRYTVN